MPGWEDLPDNVKKHIMSFTLMAPFQGGRVPSVGQLAITSQVSKGFEKTSKAAAGAIDQDTVVALRSPAKRVMLSLMTRLVNNNLDERTCADYLYRLSFTKEMSDAMRENLQTLSTRLGSGQQRVSGIEGDLRQFVMAWWGDAMTDSGYVGDNLDGKGLRALALRISKLYPQREYLCVALGASADPVAVALGMLGHTVVYIPISGIEQIHKNDSGTEFRVKKLMAEWPRKFHKILLLDAMASGAALDVMQHLVLSVSKTLGWQCSVVALSLNQLEEGQDDAAALVRQGTVQVLDRGSKAFDSAQTRISGQEYKTGRLGRLFAKNVKDAPIDNAALKRMVATLLSDKM